MGILIDFSNSLFSILGTGSTSSDGLIIIASLWFSFIAIVLSFLSLKRSRSSYGGVDLKPVKDRVNQIAIRLDDMNSKINTSHTNLIKENSQLAEKIKLLEEIIASRPAELRPLQLQFDSGENLEERLLALEERLSGYVQGFVSGPASSGILDKGSSLELSFDDEASGNKPPTLVTALEETRNKIRERLTILFEQREKLGKRFYSTLEKRLVEMNLGAAIASSICSTVESTELEIEDLEPEDIYSAIKQIVVDILEKTNKEKFFSRESTDQPRVIIIAGADDKEKIRIVAGIAQHFAAQEARVLVATCDSSQAAATQQLEDWCQQAGIDVVAGLNDRKPKKIAYKSVHKAQDDKFDVLLIDAVGTLATEFDLIHELEGIIKIVDREQPDAVHEVLLVLDASTGRKTFKLAQKFHASIALNGLCLTKLHEVEEGGIFIPLCKETRAPICFVNTGEDERSLKVFSENEFAEALLGDFDEEVKYRNGDQNGASSNP